jgi:hypothetical protein
MSPDNPHNTEPQRKMLTEAKNAGLFPNVSDIFPHSGLDTAVKIM